MNEELDPLTLGDTPEEMIELEDGSVEIPGLEAVEDVDTGFMDNLAEVLDDKELDTVASELVELIEKDKESRKKRDLQYEEGLRRTGLGDDAPGGAEFAGASKVVHPVLAEACVDFSSRAIKELFPATGPVRPWVIGDSSTVKMERAQRKTRFMNWQLTTQMQEYRAELEQLLTQLPMGGSQYQKFWYDERLSRPRCEFVPIDEMFLPYAATNFYSSPRVTHRQQITKHEFRRRVKSGLYLDVFIDEEVEFPEQSASGQANDKIEGREEDGYNDDGLRTILEVYTWQEFESDDITSGEYAPYIITIDEDTEKVLSVYRNWDENDAKFEKLDWFVEWKFIPWRGAYAIGLPHLIGGVSAALTGALRALLDSAHINNAPTMLKLKSGRIVGQNTQVNVTQVCDIEGPAGIDDIKKLAMPMPFNPPSPVLAQLMGDLYGLAKGVIATADDRISQVGDRTPVGTTMALVEQGSTTYSAIHARLHESQKKSLQILHRINSKYLDDDIELDAIEGEHISREDFTGSMDVIPVSDPTIFSESQRFAQTQAMIQLAAGDAQNPNIPWNMVELRRRALKQMRIDNIDQLLPAPPTPVTADVATENYTARQNKPIKASLDQDHFAHIKGHIAYFTSPMVLQNPIVKPEIIAGMLGHLDEHLSMLEAATIQKSALALKQEYMMRGENPSDEALAGMATAKTMEVMQGELTAMMQQMAQMQQELDKRKGQPPMPPEVQASLQIGMAEVQRKTQADQQNMQAKQADSQMQMQLRQAELQQQLQLRQVELQQNIQLRQAELQTRSQQAMQQAQIQAGSMQAQQAQQDQRIQLEMQRMQFEQQMQAVKADFERMLKEQQEASKVRIAELQQEVELTKNQEDNARKEYVDLVKNREDNKTKLIIAGIQSTEDKDK